MSDPDNIKEFNYIVVGVLGELYTQFSKRVKAQTNQFSSSKCPNDMGNQDKIWVMGTVIWLKSTGYILFGASYKFDYIT